MGFVFDIISSLPPSPFISDFPLNSDFIYLFLSFIKLLDDIYHFGQKKLVDDIDENGEVEFESHILGHHNRCHFHH